MKQVRWACPIDAHAAVLGPSRPRRDNLCCYCLECSKGACKLIERVSPLLERKRKAKRAVRLRKATIRRVKQKVTRGMGPETETRFRCGARVERIVDPTTAGWPSGLRYVMVVPSKKRRKSRVEVSGVTVYDFEGADQFDARALVAVGVARWQTTHGWQGRAPDATVNSALTWMREIITWHVKVRPRLDNLAKAEEEVAYLLLADAALQVLKENAR